MKKIIENLEEEILLYKKILHLSKKETEVIEKKEIEKIIFLLEEKQQYISKIGEIEKEIQKEITGHQNIPEIQKLGIELGQILKEVLQIEKANQDLLIKEFNLIKSNLGEIQDTRKFIKSYEVKTENIPHFFDKKK